MAQFLNNLWIALSTENIGLINIFSFPLNVIETYLSMKIFLTIFNINASKKQSLIYVILISIISLLSTNFIMAPFNVIINYSCKYSYFFIFNY